MPAFMFLTGIENSYPTVALPDGKTARVDEMDKCGHYRHWREDFELVKDLGVDALRYGPPYYRCHLGSGRYDWSFPDEAFNALHAMGIRPIADLCHFGVPDWIGNFQNPDWPPLFAEFARAFAARYPWIRYFTPVNEIFITAMFSGQYGWWNERLTTESGFVTALHNACKANVMAMHAILQERPDAIFVQSESSEYFHAEDPKAQPLAHFLNQKRFLSLDLTYGFEVNVTMYEYLLSNGMTRDQYHWFLDNHVKARCIMGNDYYVTNEHLVYEDGTTGPSGEIFGYYVITHQYWDRFRLPVMHTETNISEPDSVRWLKKEWANLHRLKLDGVPITGFTWFSLTDQVDWDTALREDNGRVNPLGLYDLDRKIRPVGEEYKKLVREWKKIMPGETMNPQLPF